jgi:3-oxoacyl-[acyl-carrier-protein] synthase III
MTNFSKRMNSSNRSNECIRFPLKIQGVGRYLPQRVVFNSELEKLHNLPRGWIERHNGVCERRWADRKIETNAFMGARAAEEALCQANLSIRDIDLILNASGTFQQPIPDTAPLIQYELGRDAYGIPSMSVGATCLSFLVALDTAASLLVSGRYQRILIVTSDIASGNLNPHDPETATLLGDAAAAVVITLPSENEPKGILSARLETYSEGAHFTEVVAGGTYISAFDPEARESRNHYFSMQGLHVLRMAKTHLSTFLENLQPGLSTSLLNIDIVVPHQASLMGLKLLSRFNWPEERIAKTLPFLGNTVAATIPITLYEAIQKGLLKRGNEALLLGTGAGLSFGAIHLVY